MKKGICAFLINAYPPIFLPILKNIVESKEELSCFKPYKIIDNDGFIFVDARAMKTINFQLSSQKCIDEGYVIRAPSPLLDQEVVANPFEIEPLEWYTSAGDATEESEEVSQDEDGAFHYDKNRVGH